jgi:hypothetical protein
MTKPSRISSVRWTACLMLLSFLGLSDSPVGLLLAIPNARLRVALSMQGVSHESPEPQFPKARR